MFSERLLELRKKQHLSQYDLGKKLGVSATTIYKWEHQQCEPGINSLNMLADIFGVSVDSLCAHETPSDPSEEVVVMNRAFRRMTTDEQQKLLAVGRTLFSHAFEEQQP